MTDTPWTYHTTQTIPSRKTYRVMQGLMPIAICKREKHARQIVGMKDTNAELLQACNDALYFLKNPEYTVSPHVANTLIAILNEAIAKAKANG